MEKNSIVYADKIFIENEVVVDDREKKSTVCMNQRCIENKNAVDDVVKKGTKHMYETWMRKGKRGSMTIEAAAVMPLILLVLFSSIYLCFFVHNRAWLTAAAYEAALTGSMEGVKTNGKVYETAHMRTRELGSFGFFGAENLTGETFVGNDKVSVHYDLDTLVSYGGLNWHLSVFGESRILWPVKRIRQIKAAAEIFSALEG